MDYQRVYSQFIANRTANPPADGEYTEKHHIVPKACGGDDSKDNLINLTAEDHYFAHILIAKIYGGSMWLAVKWMRDTAEKYNDINPGVLAKKSSMYSYLRKRASEHRSISMRERWKSDEYKTLIADKMSEVYKRPEFKAKQAESSKARFEDDVYKNNIVSSICNRWKDKDFKAKMVKLHNSPEHKEKMKVVRASPEYKAKLKAANKSPETIARRAAALDKRWASAGSKERQAAKSKEVGRKRVKPVINLDTGEIFNNCCLAYDWLLAGNAIKAVKYQRDIATVCNPKSNNKTAGGYRWAYIPVQLPLI